MNIRILLFWVIVAIPLTWGVLQSVNSALPLFGVKSVYIAGLTVPPPSAKPIAPAMPVATASPTRSTTDNAAPMPTATATP